MNKTIFLAAAFIVPCAFAVDGVVLINQSTVGTNFPYIISQPGSYKLSSNLTMSTTPNGNYQGFDFAILINASGVTLDLNGFSIIVTNKNSQLQHNVSAIIAANGSSQVSVKNGAITMNSVPLASPVGFICANLLDFTSLEDLSIFNNIGISATVGAHSLVRHNVFSPAIFSAGCASLVSENTGADRSMLDSCVVAVNNAP